MPNYDQEISIERQRIAVFVAKLDQCRQRLASLEYLKSNAEDALDTWASNIIETGAQISADYQVALSKTTTLKGSNSVQVNHSSVGAITVMRKKLSEKALKLLSYIGKEGKSLQQLAEFVGRNDLDMTNQNIRNFAMVYRKNFHYIENPRVGFYRLTDLGEEVIQKQMKGAKNETPTEPTEGVSGISPESTLTGGFRNSSR